MRYKSSADAEMTHHPIVRSKVSCTASTAVADTCRFAALDGSRKLERSRRVGPSPILTTARSPRAIIQRVGCRWQPDSSPGSSEKPRRFSTDRQSNSGNT
jgi:hypothetical protein